MTNRFIIEVYKVSIGMDVDAPLHTYAKWQELGYQVKKGEKSQHRIQIWKACSKKVVHDEESGHELTSTKCIPKIACFFTLDQVEKMTVTG